MLDFIEEKQLFSQGYTRIGGIDEAGRGPLAGPVVAACVVCPRDFKVDEGKMDLIKDSKKLNEKRREEMYEIINEIFPSIGVGICDHETIDRINILQAAFLAMKKAVGAVQQKPEYILLDGKFPIPNMSIPQKPIIKGDALVFSIAAASIVAKVTRDRIMKKLHNEFPMYDFEKHKGYGTKIHMERLQEHGPSSVHRKSFGPVKKLLNY